MAGQEQGGLYLTIGPSTLSTRELGGTLMKPEHRRPVAAFTGPDEERVYELMSADAERARLRAPSIRICNERYRCGIKPA